MFDVISALRVEQIEYSHFSKIYSQFRVQQRIFRYSLRVCALFST